MILSDIYFIWARRVSKTKTGRLDLEKNSKRSFWQAASILVGRPCFATTLFLEAEPFDGFGPIVFGLLLY